MPTKTTVWDMADHIKSPEDAAAHLQAALEDGDTAVIAHTLGAIARAQNMAKLARETKLSRETLYRSLSKDGNPSLDTLLKVTRALGLQLQIAPTPKN